ncbi:hypothetical protein HAX54_038353 [Datura stramonium]|uniref:Uncharacterized protein n=1 Tax=Datura stramonium TaxID=4076 RepID=A0ABS8SI18_DATST|nr:hypothetical protein [Datura stramonium]
MFVSVMKFRLAVEVKRSVIVLSYRYAGYALIAKANEVIKYVWRYYAATILCRVSTNVLFLIVKGELNVMVKLKSMRILSFQRLALLEYILVKKLVGKSVACRVNLARLGVISPKMLHLLLVETCDLYGKAAEQVNNDDEVSHERHQR